MAMEERELFQTLILQNSNETSSSDDFFIARTPSVDKKDKNPFILADKDGKSLLQLILLEHKAEESVIKLRGIIARNEQGQLECKIDYNHAKKTYSGILINKKYDPDKGFFYLLNDQQAEYYYKKFGHHTTFGQLATP